MRVAPITAGLEHHRFRDSDLDKLSRGPLPEWIETDAVQHLRLVPADRYCVLEPFQRSSGNAPLTVAQHVEDLHELIRSRPNDSPPALLGCSWGAMLALAYAAAHPPLAGPLLLVGCGTFDSIARGRMQDIISERMNPEVRKRLKSVERLKNGNARLQAFADAIAPIYSYDPLPSSPGEEMVDAKAQRETWDDMVRLQTQGVYPAAFSSIKAPVLMVHGDYDPHPGGLIYSSLKPLILHLEYRELDRCGHYPWREKHGAEAFFYLIDDWLAQKRGQRRVRTMRSYQRPFAVRCVPRPHSIAGRNDAAVLDHEHHGSLGGAGAVCHSSRNYEALARTELHRAVVKVDEKLAFDHIKELIVMVVLVPVILALNHT
jgi:pimeloyl-ACP methyl ester carboxylesterase